MIQYSTVLHSSTFYEAVYDWMTLLIEHILENNLVLNLTLCSIIFFWLFSQNNPDKATGMPPDGTVHELTSNVSDSHHWLVM